MWAGVQSIKSELDRFPVETKASGRVGRLDQTRGHCDRDHDKGHDQH